jgi:hypothetical protein
MIKKFLCLIFLTVFIAITACMLAPGSSSQPGENHPPTAASDPSKTIFFPRQEKTNGEWAAMDALARGTLVLADNCIRLERDKPLANYLLIWPPDFNISIENGTIKIVNGDGKIVASIGDRVQMSGGEIHLLSQLDKSIQEQVPPQCTGPYWIMGYEFTTVNPSKYVEICVATHHALGANAFQTPLPNG